MHYLVTDRVKLAHNEVTREAIRDVMATTRDKAAIRSAVMGGLARHANNVFDQLLAGELRKK